MSAGDEDGALPLVRASGTLIPSTTGGGLGFFELIDQTIQLARRVSRSRAQDEAVGSSGCGMAFAGSASTAEVSPDGADDSADQLAAYLADSVRGNQPLIFCDAPRDLPTVFDGVAKSALGIMIASGDAHDGRTVMRDSDLDIPVSTQTHELKQLRYNRPGVPLCEQGQDCVACQIPGGALLGPLPIYLFPTEQVDLETTGLCIEGVKASRPRQCLLCIRRLLDCVRMACESYEGVDGVGRNFVRAPFTNVVGVDGYRQEAIGIRPSHHCIAGGASIVRSDIPLRIEYDKLTRPEGFIVAQDPTCLFSEGPSPPCL